MGADELTAGGANRLRPFWTPKLRAEIIAFAAAGDAGLNPVAARAVAALKGR